MSRLPHPTRALIASALLLAIAPLPGSAAVFTALPAGGSDATASLGPRAAATGSGLAAAAAIPAVDRPARPAAGVLAVAAVAAAPVTEPASSRPAAPAAAAAPGFVVNCGGKPVQLPEEIQISCADGDIMITGIRWTRWSGGGASGSGTLVFNSCIYTGGPACMEGRTDSYRAEMALGHPVAGGKALFNELRLSFAQGGRAHAGGPGGCAGLPALPQDPLAQDLEH